MSETRRTPYYTDPDQGFDLFRDAILSGMQKNWETVYQIYAPLVYSWVYQHPSFIHTGEEACYFVNAAFEKFWCALTPVKFANFPDLKALLAYLQLCVHSVIVDYLRVEKRHRGERGLRLEEHYPCSLNVEQKVHQETWRQEFWQHIKKRLKNEREYELIYYRFVQDIKPRELCEQYPEMFPNIREVYTMTQKILARLGRSPEFARFRCEMQVMRRAAGAIAEPASISSRHPAQSCVIG